MAVVDMSWPCQGPQNLGKAFYLGGSEAWQNLLLVQTWMLMVCAENVRDSFLP